jgi:hypothetical protein
LTADGANLSVVAADTRSRRASLFKAFFVAEAVAAPMFWAALMTWWFLASVVTSASAWRQTGGAIIIGILQIGLMLSLFTAVLAVVPVLLVGTVVIALRFRARIAYIFAGMVAGVLSILALGIPDGSGVLYDMASAATDGTLLAAALAGSSGGYAAWRSMSKAGALPAP